MDVICATPAGAGAFLPILFLITIMNKIPLLKSVGLLIGAFSLLNVHNAHSQTLRGYNVIVADQNTSGGQFVLQAGPDNNSPYIHMFPSTNTNGIGGSINMITGYSPDPNRPIFSVQVRDAATNANWQRRLDILQNGQVRIGGTGGNVPVPSSQSDYKLAVAGKIVGQSMYVTNPNTWADFVFEPSYEPMALPTLESYLQKNKHLPYIPSAKEVEANGYNVAEMDAKLLQTVEELTLQLIELGKQNKQMQDRLKSLESQSEAVTIRK